MKIAIINETSAADRNSDILSALSGRGHEIYNVGMKKSGEKPELQYIHTGFLSALLLNLKKGRSRGGRMRNRDWLYELRHAISFCFLWSDSKSLGCLVICPNQCWKLYFTCIKPGLWLGKWSQSAFYF